MLREGTLGNMGKLVRVLDDYQNETGMEIKLEKSKLSYNNVQEDTLTQPKDLIPVSVAHLSKGFKYLGFVLKTN